MCIQGEDSDDEAETDEAALASIDAWQPDPIDADPSRSARSRRMHDIISMLVGIYGGKQLFITEYRCAEQLLACDEQDERCFCLCDAACGCITLAFLGLRVISRSAAFQ